MSNSGADKHVADISAVSDLLFLTILAALIIAFIYLIVLRYLGGIIIWVTIFAIIIFTILGGFLLWQKAEDMTDPAEK